jgi:hypothetical protein
VEKVNRPGTRARKRAKRCFQLSFLSLSDMEEPGDWRLVHGIADLGTGRMFHAWLTDGREIFDPVVNAFWPVEEYCDGRFVPLVTYTLCEATEEAVRSGHSGPWHEDIGFWDSPLVRKARAKWQAKQLTDLGVKVPWREPSLC